MTPECRRLIAVLVMCVSLAGCRDGSGPGSGEPGITLLSTGSASDTIGMTTVLGVRVRDESGRARRGIEVEFRVVSTHRDNPERGSPLAVIKGGADQAQRVVVLDTTDALGRADVTVKFTESTGTADVVVRATTLGFEATASYATRPGAPVLTDISPLEFALNVGTSRQVIARHLDRRGNTASGPATFTALSSGIEVSPTGVVHGRTIGRDSMRVVVGTRTETVRISVVPVATIAVVDMGSSGDSSGYAQMTLDGSGHKWIARTGARPSEYSPGNTGAPQWLRGTGQIVFTRAVQGELRMFIGDSTGAERRLIPAVYAAVRETNPEVSPDGTWVYFVGTEANGLQGLWRVPSVGGVPERLTTSEPRAWGSPSVSPDGTRLAVAATSPAHPTQRHLYVHDLATGVTTRILASEAATPRWSPTGEWIVYAVSAEISGYSGALHIVRPNGSGDRLLTAGAYFPGGTWSADGRYFLAIEALPPVDFQLIDITTGTRLPIRRFIPVYGPTWRY